MSRTALKVAFFSLAAALAASNPFFPGEYVWLRRLLVIALILLCGRIFLNRPFKVLKLVTGIGLCLFLLCEAWLMNFPYTFGPGDSLGSKIWFERYWKPINSLGFRDAEPPAGDSGKTKVLVIGDSFTAAQGIDNIEERFTEILQRELGKNYQVWNAGECGAGPEKEFENLKKFPHQPDIVVLQWFVNDIEDAARLAGKSFRHPAAKGWKWNLRRAMRCSYTLDFISTLLTFSAESGYDKWLDSLFSDPAVISAHFAQLESIAEWCRSREIRLVFLVCPFLWEPSHSSAYLSPLKTYLKTTGKEFLNGEPDVLSLPQRERIVNPLDHHPGAALHALWGKSLAKQILQQ